MHHVTFHHLIAAITDQFGTCLAMGDSGCCSRQVTIPSSQRHETESRPAATILLLVNRKKDAYQL